MKKTLLTILQLCVTAGVLIWVFHDPDKRHNMWESLKNSNKWWILAAIASYGAVEVLAAIRWRVLLKVQDIDLGWIRVFALLMIGIFFNLFMPGGTGGDVVKSYYLLKEVPPGKKAASILTVLMDRVIGLLGLMFLTAFIIGVRYQWLSQTEVTRNLTWTLLAILGCSLGGIAFSFVVTGFHLVHRLPKFLPFHDKLVELSVAYNQYGRAWKASLTAFVTSLFVHIMSFYVFYFTARALGVITPIKDFFAVMPIINTLASLPISVGGAGVREKLFEELLGKLCGIPPHLAAGLSLTGFGVLAFWAIVGGIIYLFYRPSEHVPLKDITSEIKELEHRIAESK